jgi:hypothetical protein
VPVAAVAAAANLKRFDPTRCGDAVKDKRYATHKQPTCACKEDASDEGEVVAQEKCLNAVFSRGPRESRTVGWNT